VPTTDSTRPSFVGVILDITDRKRAEDAQTELARVERLTTMGQLVASIAHEINQPLGAIATNGTALLRWLNRDKPDLEEVRAATSRIMEDARRAGDVIRGLRALVANSDPRMTNLNINEAIKEVLALIRGELQRHGVALCTDLNTDEQQVCGD